MMPETYSITLKHDNGIDCLAPRTTASNVTMADGRTTEVVINEKADKDLLQLKTANFKLPSDLPNSYPNGFSAFYGSAAEWGIGAIGANYGVIVETFKFSNGYSRQTISSISTLPLKYRASGTNNVWGEWKSITTSADLELKADNPKKGRYTGDLFAISGDFYKTYDVGLLSTVINYPLTANAYAALEYIPIASTIARLRWTTYGSNPRTTYECTYNPITKTALINWQEIATTEIGTWTPTIRGNTGVGNNVYSAQLGNYVKIGKIVVLSFRVLLSEKDVAMTGVTLIGGLPFLPKDKGGSNHNHGQIVLRNITLTSDERFSIIARSNILEILNQTNATLTNLSVSRLNNNTEIAGSITYEID